MIKEEELYKVIEELKIKVERIEKSLDSCYKTLDHLWKSFYLFKEKIEVIGIQQKWFMKDSIEYKCYDEKSIQKLSTKYNLNTNIKSNEFIEVLSKGEHKQEERLQKIRNHFIEKPLVRLSVNDIMNINHVSFHTAKKDMKLLIAKEPSFLK